jgi:hypothetical protein
MKKKGQEGRKRTANVARFVVLSAVQIQVEVFWVMMP